MFDTTVSGGRVEEGRALRDAALNTHQSKCPNLIAAAQRALLVVLLRDGKATIDAVRAKLGTMPDGARPVWLGAVPKSLLAAGIIERARFATSARAEAHARPVSIWRLIDRPAAEQRLAALAATIDTATPSAVLPHLAPSCAAQPQLF